MSLRYLTSPDDPAFREVLRIYHESFEEASREPDERLFEELRGEYRLPFRFLVRSADVTPLKDQTQITGFARFCQVPEADFGFLIHIAIAENVRGSGQGTELLRAVVDALAPNPVFVEIERRGRVREWYERNGFHPVTETYHQPALHDHTNPVPYALFASDAIGDPEQAILDFYRQVWQLGPTNQLVREATRSVGAPADAYPSGGAP